MFNGQAAQNSVMAPDFGIEVEGIGRPSTVVVIMFCKRQDIDDSFGEDSVSQSD